MISRKPPTSGAIYRTTNASSRGCSSGWSSASSRLPASCVRRIAPSIACPRTRRQILDNPYLLCEAFVPSRDEEPIPFVTVDHALLPHESMAAPVERVPRRDPRRLRALLVEVLRAAADEGHTFLAAEDALEQAAQRSPEDRRCDVPVDRLTHEKVAPVLASDDRTVRGRGLDVPRAP